MRHLPKGDYSLSRRRFCGLLGFVPFFLPRGAGAQEELDAATLYLVGTALLRHGHTFEKAASYLRQATQKEPDNYEYQMALGCAYASRLASLSHAALAVQKLATTRARFPEDVRQWQQLRDSLQAKGEDAALIAVIDASRPAEPAARDFLIKDDNTAYRLTIAQREAQLQTLVEQAQAAWARGLALCKSPAEQAESRYLRGWGRRVLQRYLRDLPDTRVVPPTDTQVRDDFEQATRLAPDNYLLWQAKAEVLGEEPGALSAYQKAAGLAQRNATLWYQVYRLTVKKSDGLTAEKWAEARTFLRQAQARDRSNAWPCYEEAGILFSLSPFDAPSAYGDKAMPPKAAPVAPRPGDARKNGRRAIDLLVSGNGLPHYEIPLYAQSIPSLLAQAWQYRWFLDRVEASDVEGYGRIFTLARNGLGYAQAVAEADRGEGVRACRAVIGMGYRLIGDWPLHFDIRASQTNVTLLVGSSVCDLGYVALIRLYQAAGDTDNLIAAQNESRAFKARRATYDKEYLAVVARDKTSASDYY